MWSWPGKEDLEADGTGRGEGVGGRVWCEDGAELGPRELRATVEELVCRKRKTKAEGRGERKGEK